MNKVTSKDGTAIAFDQAGTGPALILVDGAFGNRAFGPMGALALLLAPYFTVITFDRRGRNDSGDTAPYAVEREVEDLAALITAAGGSAGVYGISSGAVLAFEAASQLPTITKLALYEPPLVLDDSRPAVPADYLEQFHALQAAGRPGDMVELFMTKGVGMPVEFVAPMRQSPVWPALESLAPTLIYDTTIMGDFALSPARTQRLAAIHVPTLVLGGGASPAWLHHAVNAVTNAIPGAQRGTLEGQTHEVSAEVLAPVLVEFFAA